MDQPWTQLPSAVDRRSKVGVRFTYANRPVRQALVKAGLYKDIPATDPLLTQFRAHLKHDLQMRKRGTPTSTVTRVARLFYYFQSCCLLPHSRSLDCHRCIESVAPLALAAFSRSFALQALPALARRTSYALYGSSCDFSSRLPFSRMQTADKLRG